MRLLHAETRTLHQFFGDDIPPYAALSHTWEAQELTFDDIPRSGSVPSNLKIDGCCEQTLAYHFKWVWIDTICIDKSSSAELTEAINSMYAWYERSKLCFAYLSDVEATVDLTSPGSEFYRSRWFTRGWTLQELVAPATVLFFNKHWKYVGSKGKLVGAADLTPILARITRVPQDVLRRNASRKSVSIASRMTWAAGRRTTRIEDMAYCLLGIFDVNLPMLYGEGSRAFLRLQEEIIRNSDDESIFAWGFDQLIADSFRLRGRAQVNASTLLASSPADFAGCRNLRPLSAHHSWFKSYYSTHYAMTNKGLLIERPIATLPYVFDNLGTVLIPLNCHVVEDSDGVANITEGLQTDTYIRILALPLQGGLARDARLLVQQASRVVAVSQSVFQQARTERIYIDTSIRSFVSPSICLASSVVLGIQEHLTNPPVSFRILEIFPGWEYYPRAEPKLDSSGICKIGDLVEVDHLKEMHSSVLICVQCSNERLYVLRLTATNPFPSTSDGRARRLKWKYGIHQPSKTDVSLIQLLAESVPEALYSTSSHFPGTTSEDGYVRLELRNIAYTPFGTRSILTIHCGEPRPQPETSLEVAT